jgi:hypothetical protein
MSVELQKLRQKRMNWVESNKENGFDEGINRLLTELYPDNAHFIYELLQNAEDPQATEVQFKLTDSSVEFTHNGKRLFSFKDVESITSIGNSTKRDDATSIGKFGVGFKAVFAYTNTPEIHSGDFHFRIRDLVVPDTEGVKQLASNQQQTSFIFPFDNPKKPGKSALQEIEKGLLDLSDNTLLFLRHIRKITYKLPNGLNGSIRRIDHNRGRIEIRTENPDGKTIISHWLHFHKDIQVLDENGVLKTCNIAVAYNLIKIPSNKTKQRIWTIEPLSHGQVSIYFPAEKETSNLRFHIHAPFASTVARDSVRACNANDQLRDGIAELVVESIVAICDQGMLDISFLAVLPIPTDNLAGNAPFYEPIRKAIVEAFRNKELTPTRSGRYAPALALYRGPARITEVLSDSDISLLTNSKPPFWAANAPLQNQREDKFLESLQIKPWGWAELAKLFGNFDNTKKELIENWLKQKSDKWLMTLYALLGEACSANRQTLSVGNLKIIRVSVKQGDELVIPSQAFFPSTEGISAPPDILIVKDSLYAIGRSDEQKRLSKFFLERSGVLTFDTKQVINLKLDYYQTQPEPIPEKYWDDMKMFCEYWLKNQYSNIEIFRNKIFLRAKSKNGEVVWCKPSDIYIDKPFADTGLKSLFNQDAFKLEKYKNELLENYFNITNFTVFSIALGVMDRLEIAEYQATKMQENYFPVVGRKTDTTIDKDYFINSISGGWQRKQSQYYIGSLPILSKSKEISYAIWKTICRAKPEQFTASYIPNQANQHLGKTSRAHFIKQLSDCAWIPDRDGNFLDPANLTAETLHPDFQFDNTNGWLTTVKFGENFRKLSEAYQAENHKAREFGFESAERASKWAELDKMGISPDELLAKQKPIEQPEKSVPNPDRRRKGVLERSENAPNKESVMRERSIQPGISATQAGAKAYLRAIYTNKNGEMVCQCCQKEMPFKIGDDYYFEAVECFKNAKNQYIENRLALCPVCSAMYQYARQTDDKEIQKLIITNDSDDGAASVEMSITLALEKYKLRFVGSHWFDLKSIILSTK